jgi:exonuclease I
MTSIRCGWKVAGHHKQQAKDRSSKKFGLYNGFITAQERKEDQRIQIGSVVTNNYASSALCDMRIDTPFMPRSKAFQQTKKALKKEMIQILKGVLPVPGKDQGSRVKEQEKEEKTEDKIGPADQGYPHIDELIQESG